MLADLTARARGFYARSLYLPVAGGARTLRGYSRRLRGVQRRHEQKTGLPEAAWSDVFSARAIRLVDAQKRLGNVTTGELAVLATAAASADRNREIIEIGTFDGRTTLNLAINAPESAPVVTLDLPQETSTRYELAANERLFVDKPAPGARFRAVPPPWTACAAKITQLFGDSATFDWTPHVGRASLVFVDGSHAYEYAKCDSSTALTLVGNKGVVIWHDYGVWDGVTRALEELEANNHLGLRHISGTTLVVFTAR